MKSQDARNRSRTLLWTRILEWRRDDEGRASPPDGVAIQGVEAGLRAVAVVDSHHPNAAIATRALNLMLPHDDPDEDCGVNFVVCHRRVRRTRLRLGKPHLTGTAGRFFTHHPARVEKRRRYSLRNTVMGSVAAARFAGK